MSNGLVERGRSSECEEVAQRPVTAAALASVKTTGFHIAPSVFATAVKSTRLLHVNIKNSTCLCQLALAIFSVLESLLCST